MWVGGWEAGGSTPEGSGQPATEGSQAPGLAEPQWGQNCSVREGVPREEGVPRKRCGEEEWDCGVCCGTLTNRRLWMWPLAPLSLELPPLLQSGLLGGRRQVGGVLR